MSVNIFSPLENKDVDTNNPEYRANQEYHVEGGKENTDDKKSPAQQRVADFKERLLYLILNNLQRKQSLSFVCFILFSNFFHKEEVKPHTHTQYKSNNK